MRTRKLYQILLIVVILVTAMVIGTSQTWAITLPDLGVCTDVTCANLPFGPICSAEGFKITLTNFQPANTSNGGTATYTYEICSPAAGTCSGTARPGESCLDNTFCQKKGQVTDPTATCSRECATDSFNGLSHFDVTFPALGGIGSCLGATTDVTGTCTAVDNTPLDGHTAAVGSFVLGDGSCFTATSPVAKCDSTDLNPGDCLDMTVSIAGETNGLGLGAAVLVDKEATTCTASCIAGPSCDSCEGLPPGGACLTRTIGFWGTHPAIAAQYDPVTICGFFVNGQDAATCSTSEALCTSANDLKKNPVYLSLVAQLTAAKLNLNATAALFSGATCANWTYNGKTIQQWLATCEGSYCGEKKQNISTSGCIAALTAFNESQDTGFDVTPAPFDKPGPANVEQCQLSRGNGKYIGIGLCP